MIDEPTYFRFVGEPAPKPPNPSDYPNQNDLTKARYEHKRKRQLWKYANSAPVVERIKTKLAKSKVPVEKFSVPIQADIALMREDMKKQRELERRLRERAFGFDY